MTPGPIRLRLLGPVEIETPGAGLAGTKVAPRVLRIRFAAAVVLVVWG